MQLLHKLSIDVEATEILACLKPQNFIDTEATRGPNTIIVMYALS
jgi:hypothetical protein